jgi:hypothetical protein
VRNLFRFVISISAVAALCISAIGPKAAKGQAPAESVANSPAQIRALKITVLSTMLVGETVGLGEWGFSALVEADGHRILLDIDDPGVPAASTTKPRDVLSTSEPSSLNRHEETRVPILLSELT